MMEKDGEESERNLKQLKPNTKSRDPITFDERMQIVLWILIATCVATVALYGYLRSLPSSQLPIGLRNFSRFVENPFYLSNISKSSQVFLEESILFLKSRLFSLSLPMVTSAPYIWSRKKSRKSGSARHQGTVFHPLIVI